MKTEYKILSTLNIIAGVGILYFYITYLSRYFLYLYKNGSYAYSYLMTLLQRGNIQTLIIYLFIIIPLFIGVINCIAGLVLINKKTLPFFYFSVVSFYCVLWVGLWMIGIVISTSYLFLLSVIVVLISAFIFRKTYPLLMNLIVVFSLLVYVMLMGLYFEDRYCATEALKVEGNPGLRYSARVECQKKFNWISAVVNNYLP